MSEYEERKQARIDRYREKAEKARQESRQLSHESISMLEHIPPGQPILVGHHSEQGHRNLLKRSDQKMVNPSLHQKRRTTTSIRRRPRSAIPLSSQMTQRP